MNKKQLICLGIMAACVQPGYAKPDGGLSFYHEDWELACDNTRTCRAAGYQADENQDNPVSVLLTRKAGSGQAVTGELTLGTYDAEDSNLQVSQLDMRINGKSVGKVAISKDLTASLSASQVAALLATSKQSADVRFVAKQGTWQLSGAGMAAVLLKMDEFQGRLNTRGALVKKGSLSEVNVLPALPVPVVKAVKVKASSVALSGAELAVIEQSLKSTLKSDDDYCPMLTEAEPADEKTPVQVMRLNGQKLLASTLCWRGAYNEGYGYWLMNSKRPYQPVLVTVSADSTQANEFDGEIFSAQKGRGLGDCWSTERWVWDGRQFAHVESSTTGMCKLVAAGGAWSLPTIVSKVQ